jgi:GNAT superfamily N-acetyltransferase
MSAPQHNLELLRLQRASALDGRGRIVDGDGVTIASCAEGRLMWIGAAVADAVAAELVAAFERAAPPEDPSEPPPALEVCARILASTGDALQRDGGPSYVIRSDAQRACDVEIERSDGIGADRLRGANPGNWHPVEWNELLDGRLGPWAIAIQGERAISICHTPGPFTARAAECGAWTDPRHRGRGYAAATVSAWVELVRSPERTLFYSTDADNLSSQRVARRLGLEAFGWTWRVRRAGRDAGLQVHPLCSLYRRSGAR